MPCTTSVAIKAMNASESNDPPMNGSSGAVLSMATSQTHSLSSSSFDVKVANSLEVIRETFRRYQPAELFLSFNGGKDCTVLLHLVDTVLRELTATGVAPAEQPQLLCLYLQTEHPFAEIDRFVDECTRRYAIRLERSTPVGQSSQQALTALCAARPALRACLMGCRRTDPWCERLETFEATTAGWPALMRVNPLLEWTCADVWDYVDRFAVPYCTLYDEGYTSLGDQTNTRPNPHLRYVDAATGREAYRPAHTLRHANHLERVGRFVPAAAAARRTDSNDTDHTSKEPATS